MAELGQIIVNRVKPLLDTANNAGYETGYGNGFDSGYVSGEESVREYVDTQVEISKKAIIGRGGNISSDAGLEDLPNAIFNIPADASLAHYTDGDIAYQKNVPVGAEKYALLKSVGGMTYKSNNLLPYPYFMEGNGTVNGVNYSITIDGAISLNGTSNSSDVSNIVLINSSAPIAFEAGTYTFRQNRSNNDTNAYMVWAVREEGAKTQYLDEDTVMTFSKPFTLWCAVQIKGNATVNTVFRPMFYKGTATLPHERHYEGLRDSKVTEILNHGKNFLPPEALIKDNWVNYEGNKWVYQLNLPDGWYCLSLKLQAGATNTIFYLQGYNGSAYTVTSSCYDGNGAITSGYLATNDKLANSVVWFKVDNNAGKTYRFYSLDLQQSRLDNLYDVQIERVNLTKEPSSSYPPATYAPPTEYIPYREPIIAKSIPKEIQALDGWGKGLRSASGHLTTQRDFYNICDFSTKQYTQWVSETITIDGENVKVVKLGSTTGEIHIDLRRPTGTYADYTALQLTKFTPSLSKTPNTAYLTAQGSSLRLNLFTTETFATVEEANEWLKANSIEAIYAFKEPVITDISDILTDDNFIEVESGGSLEFVNEYKYAVPSTIKYTVKVGS